MIGLLQRVTYARVIVEDRTVAEIDAGLLVLTGIERGDTAAEADRLIERLLGYRVFPDAGGRMNRSLADTGGSLLLVPQFTLAADTEKGTRPGFSRAADPQTGRAMYEYLVERARSSHHSVASGLFGAHMQVHLCNDGPVTFSLRVIPDQAA